MKSKFKVGDDVFHIDCGWGKVDQIGHPGNYKIMVTFGSGTTGFTLEGSLYAGGPVSLSHTEYGPNTATFPRLMEVSVCELSSWTRRLVLFIKDDKAYFPEWAQDLNDVKQGAKIITAAYYREIHEPEVIELTFQDISDGKGVGVDPKLIKIKAN